MWHVDRPGYGGTAPARTPGSVSADAGLVRRGGGATWDSRASIWSDASYSAAVVLTLAGRSRPELARSLAPWSHRRTARAAQRSSARPTPDCWRSTRAWGRGPPSTGSMRHDRRSGLACERRARPAGLRRCHGARRRRPSSSTTSRRSGVEIRRREAAARSSARCSWWGEAGAATGSPACSTASSESWATTSRVMIPGAGHSVALTHATDVAAAVRGPRPCCLVAPACRRSTRRRNS